MSKLTAKQRFGTVLLAVIIWLTIAAAFLQVGTIFNTHTTVHWTPDYAEIDILPLLKKEVRTPDDYSVLYAQTGLTKLGIDDLIEDGNIPRILEIQDNFFRPYTVETSKFAPFTGTQSIDGHAAYASLANGDIIVSSSAFFSWFRCGHAAMVVDAQEEMAINAVALGVDSSLDPISHFEQRANFLVLRPKLSPELLQNIVDYAKETLVDLPYRLTAGLLSEKFQEPLTGTQCSHLVWYAFRKFGIDLDADGGWLVTPKDLTSSPMLELVQTFGFDPQTLWD